MPDRSGGDPSSFEVDPAELAAQIVARQATRRQQQDRPAIRRLKALTAGELLTMEIPEREMLLAPIIPTKGLGMIYSKRGVGKTFVALSVAYAVASAGVFLRWKAPEPRRVLLIDGECRW